ncbi:Lysophospholipid acyltransferase [Marasmius tenuissimus]|uniref:Lysophospholipid acyltransferase n=1 Tax=Marasmius tenuissimus TaxID=585030 RepID=A0ABR2ZTZ5_9AGAR
MDALFAPLVDATGASPDQIKLIVCLLIAYPLGSLYVRIPSNTPTLRHLFSIGIALFFLLPMLNMYTGLLQLLGDMLFTYFVAKYHKGSAMPWIVFFFVLGHLMANHIIRVIYNLSYETIEVTGPQMVLVMKLTTYAWNVFDGRRKKEDLDAWQLANCITEYPSLVEFLGYCFYFPGFLVGPYLIWSDYMSLVHENVFKDQKIKGSKGRNLADGRKRVGYRKMFMGLAFLGTYVVFGGQYNYTVILTSGFAKKTLLERIASLQLYGTMERCKYYALWTLTEGASIITGLGFTGFTPSGQSTWNGAANVSPLAIEWPSNFKVLLDSWNMRANVWLRECVYKRVTPKGKKPGFWSSMMTFAVSAFWHGAAVGYYLTFLMGGFITTAARLVRSNVRPLVLPEVGKPAGLAKRLYDIVGTLISILILNYVTPPFMLLTWKESIEAWNRLAWYGHIIIMGGLVFFYVGGAKFFRSLQKKSASERPKFTPTPSGAATPIGEKTFQLPPSFDKLAPPPKS